MPDDSNTLLNGSDVTEQPADEPENLGEVKDIPSENPNGDNPSDKETEKPVVPENYDFTPPEGVEYDAETIGVYSEAAREAGLSQEQANIILGKLAPHIESRQQAQLEKISADWREASKTDKEFGGEKLKPSLAVANKALKQFASPELIQFLDSSGLGNHPEIIRMLSRVGNAVSQDGFVAGNKPSETSNDPQEFFSKSNMNP